MGSFKLPLHVSIESIAQHALNRLNPFCHSTKHSDVEIISGVAVVSCVRQCKKAAKDEKQSLRMWSHNCRVLRSCGLAFAHAVPTTLNKRHANKNKWAICRFAPLQRSVRQTDGFFPASLKGIESRRAPPIQPPKGQAQKQITPLEPPCDP